MAYSAYADLTAQLEEATVIQLSDDNNDGIADTAVTDQAIADADGKIDSYVAIRYAIPLNPVPDLARVLSAKIAIYNLYLHRGGEVPAGIAQQYKDSVQNAKDLGAGVALWGQDVDEAPDVTQIDVRTSTATRVFGRTNLSDF